MMKIQLSVCVFATFFVLGNSLFCELRWPNCGLSIKNIVCERDEKCQAEEGCENVESDAEFLKWILHEHNRLRNEIATGKESRGFTGPAANMMALSYDKDLEFTAACNANRCKFEHDKCRGTTKFPAAGQNLFYATGNVSELRTAVTTWFEEIKLSTPDVIDKFPREREEISRFTQLIWAGSTHIGCARAKKTGSEDYFLVCNYGPSGNNDKHRVYKRGEACSKCPLFVKCNEQYPGLCGKIDQSTLGQGSGGSGIGDNKEIPVTEKTADKDVVVSEGENPGVSEVPGISTGGLGGLSENQKENNEDKNEKNKSTTEEKNDSTQTQKVSETTVKFTDVTNPTTITKITQETTTETSTDVPNSLYSTSEPDSGYVDKSSKTFILSLVLVLFGFWFIM